MMCEKQMSVENLLQDIKNFQNLPKSDRKGVFEVMYSMLSKIEDNFGQDSQRYKAYLVGIRAIDALHHLAKDNVFLTIEEK